ncbi:MAG TPA: hypothetical protein VI029_10405 [Mycobacterium sp.]
MASTTLWNAVGSMGLRADQPVGALVTVVVADPAVDGSEVDEQPAMTKQAHNASDAA